jgi:hypothetical protein
MNYVSAPHWHTRTGISVPRSPGDPVAQSDDVHPGKSGHLRRRTRQKTWKNHAAKAPMPAVRRQNHSAAECEGSQPPCLRWSIQCEADPGCCVKCPSSNRTLRPSSQHTHRMSAPATVTQRMVRSRVLLSASPSLRPRVPHHAGAVCQVYHSTVVPAMLMR